MTALIRSLPKDPAQLRARARHRLGGAGRPGAGRRAVAGGPAARIAPPHRHSGPHHRVRSGQAAGASADIRRRGHPTAPRSPRQGSRGAAGAVGRRTRRAVADGSPGRSSARGCRPGPRISTNAAHGGAQSSDRMRCAWLPGFVEAGAGVGRAGVRHRGRTGRGDDGRPAPTAATIGAVAGEGDGRAWIPVPAWCWGSNPDGSLAALLEDCADAAVDALVSAPVWTKADRCAAREGGGALPGTARQVLGRVEKVLAVFMRCSWRCLRDHRKPGRRGGRHHRTTRRPCHPDSSPPPVPPTR